MRRDPRSRSHRRLPGRRGAGHRPARDRLQQPASPVEPGLAGRVRRGRGTSPDPAYWDSDVGGGGWGNDELQFYTARPENVVAGRRRPPRHHRPEGAVPGARLHLGADHHPGQVRAGARPLGGAHPRSVGDGDLAGLLAAGRQLPPGGLAGLRRDRHHGAAGPGAGRGERHAARDRILRRQLAHRAVRLPGRRRPARPRPARRSAPSTRTSTSSRWRWRPTGSGSRSTAPSTTR